MRTCEQCGQEFSRRKTEAHWQYEKRKFCSRPCADLGRARTRVPNEEFKARYRQKTLPGGRKMLEHRWVVEQHLGRKLERWEQVHHINHDRLDNRIENLEVVTSAEHGMRHTVHPTEKKCVICGVEFTPHKTKRVRAQTCGPACKSALLSRRNAERRPQQGTAAIRHLLDLMEGQTK